MGAHCAPLRKKKSFAVSLFEAVAGLWSAPDYQIKKLESQEDSTHLIHARRGNKV